MITNSFLIVITFGLMKPWAQIRTARFILEHSSIEVVGSLDDFASSQEAEMNATIEGVADIFDLEILG